MRNCKSNLIFLTLIPFAFTTLEASAQDVSGSSNRALSAPTISMPSVPDIQTSLAMPSAPTISPSSISSTWYVPGKTNIKIIPNEKTTSVQGNKSLPQKNEETLVLQPENNGADILSSADLKAITDLGLLSNIRGILSQKNMKLSTIISELEKIKKKNALTSRSNYESIKTTAGLASASILRFSINGKDMRSNCKNILFSGIDSKGTFLVSGDCKYTQDKKSGNETFYMLFSEKGTNEGQAVYTVTAAISQDFPNEKSSLYQLSKADKLIALKTGSIVSIHTNSKDVSVDMLLSLGNDTISMISKN